MRIETHLTWKAQTAGLRRAATGKGQVYMQVAVSEREVLTHRDPPCGAYIACIVL